MGRRGRIQFVVRAFHRNTRCYPLPPHLFTKVIDVKDKVLDAAGDIVDDIEMPDEKSFHWSRLVMGFVVGWSVVSIVLSSVIQAIPEVIYIVCYGAFAGMALAWSWNYAVIVSMSESSKSFSEENENMKKLVEKFESEVKQASENTEALQKNISGLRISASKLERGLEMLGDRSYFSHHLNQFSAHI